MIQQPVERYLQLGLQLGRHVDGIVDAYYGPPELAAAVDAEPPVDPRTLVSEAETLAFDPWHAAVEHRPLGNIMRARNVAYRASTVARKAVAEPRELPRFE